MHMKTIKSKIADCAGTIRLVSVAAPDDTFMKFLARSKDAGIQYYSVSGDSLNVLFK